LHGSLDDTSYQGKTVEKGREPSPKKNKVAPNSPPATAGEKD
jgi:hypothetical protein